MGQRQSSQRQQDTSHTSNNADNNNNDNNTNENTNRRGRIFRPSARLNVERNNPVSRTLNENQRRNERRTRRARIREEQLGGVSPQQQQNQPQQGDSDNEEASIATLMSTVTEAIEAAAAIASNARNRSSTTAPTATTTTTTTTTTTAAGASDTTFSDGTAESINSPFSRMIAQVISEAVVASFRNGQIPSAVPDNPQASNVRQQLTMHLSPDLFRQLEPESTEDTFMRFMRLPVLVTSVATTPNGENNNMPLNTTTSGSLSNPTNSNPTSTSTAVNADGEAPTLTEAESEVTRIMMLPVFLYGLRSVNPNANSTNNPSISTSDVSNTNENILRQGTRSSSRIRERQRRQQQQQQQQQQQSTTPAAGGQWTVYIISGNSVENIMNDSPSYEELLDLAALIGPARRPTVSQEAIDNYVPIVKYTQQVKQTIVGNSEGCQVCLTSYQPEDAVRILACHHGFHKECIDKWLTEGQNQCPLCRGVPIPVTTSTTND